MTTTYAIDFDGTCVDHQYPSVGDDVPHAVSVLKQLAACGDKLVLFTMRSDKELDLAERWFEHHRVPLYGANINPDQNDWTRSPKVFAHHYIDDAAVGCPLIHPEGFYRPCVDWIEIAKLLDIVPPDSDGYSEINFELNPKV